MKSLFDFFPKRDTTKSQQQRDFVIHPSMAKRKVIAASASLDGSETSPKKKKKTSSSATDISTMNLIQEKELLKRREVHKEVVASKNARFDTIKVSKTVEKERKSLDKEVLGKPKLRTLDTENTNTLTDDESKNSPEEMKAVPAKHSNSQDLSEDEMFDEKSKESRQSGIVFDRKYPIGAKVRKYFAGYGWFRGKVVSYDEPFYSIHYDDGDQEQLSEGELESVIDDGASAKAFKNGKESKQGGRSETFKHAINKEQSKPVVSAKPKHRVTRASPMKPVSPKSEEIHLSEDDEVVSSADDELESVIGGQRQPSALSQRKLATSNTLKFHTTRASPKKLLRVDGAGNLESTTDDEYGSDDVKCKPPVHYRRKPARSKSPKRLKASSSSRKVAEANFDEESYQTEEAISLDEEMESIEIGREQQLSKGKGNDTAKRATVKSSSTKESNWGFLDGKGSKPKAMRKSAPKKPSEIAEVGGVSSNVRKVVRNPYNAGDDLPIISNPQDMFDDMIKTKLTQNGQNPEILIPLLKAIKSRPLRVATMCSGTESPILALDMITKSIEDLARTNVKFQGMLEKEAINPDRVFQIEHVFSCEIEPFKQAYIERNFHPPILFRDIRELGRDKAYTAYGALVPVPNKEGDVDLLVAGTSCVDYSNLNNKQKTIDQAGESGQTFFGMINWIEKAKPPIVIIENVSGAPWEVKVNLFEERGYAATFLRLDTKDMYIPHTRQRGYLFALKTEKGKNGPKLVQKWKEQLGNLKRPASAALDAFMLPNDDPRVLHGRARLMCSGDPSDGGVNKGDRVGRVDWTKCETRHQAARSSEELGDKRPLTGWSDSSSTIMPCFGGNWNDWVNQQVHRIHDLMDINTLRMAQEGMDCTHKTMVWNLSQNVDRDTMGKLGLCQCLTPTGVPYVTNRGGPLVGEELLLLQGIPADDLLLTKESEDNLKDLAGNAMSTTVVGACLLSALILGYASLEKRCTESGVPGRIVPSLVPRPLLPETDVKITQEFGRYEERELEMGQLDFLSFELLLKEADASARKCTSEGIEESIPFDSLMICQECGHTASVACALPPRKFEEHEYVTLSDHGHPRLQPSVFRSKLLALLPMQVHFKGIDKSVFNKPELIETKLWDDWVKSLLDCVNGRVGERSSVEFRFTELKRSHLWTAEFVSATGGRLELRIGLAGATWLLFAKPPCRRGPIRDALVRPLAKMTVTSLASEPSMLTGLWEFCLPAATAIGLSIKSAGKLVDGWRSKLGLRGNFVDEKRFEELEIVTSGKDKDIQDAIDGVYSLLPKCGTACGSLYRKQTPDACMYFFLESGRCTMPGNDVFVFSTTKHRTSYGEYRDVVLQIDPEENFRPVVNGQVNIYNWNIRGLTPGKWMSVASVSLADFRESEIGLSVRISTPSPGVGLIVPHAVRGWIKCPEVLSCQIPMTADDPLYSQCKACDSSLELNLHKSKKVFQNLAFVTSRFDIPDVFAKHDDGCWLLLHANEGYDEDIPCTKCAPDKPDVRWTLIKKSNSQKYVPVEDGKAAAAYEMALKNRPNPWVIRFTASNDGSDALMVIMRIGCNAISLVQRALGMLPRTSAGRRLLVKQQSCDAALAFDWRIVRHGEKLSGHFPKLRFRSNKRDQLAAQPPNFKRYELRREQLRSLHWMLSQEASSEPFWEEEVAEAVLPSLSWRAEGRVRRPVLVRGGIIADEVGYGKTAITLALVDASSQINGCPPSPPEDCRTCYLATKATLIVVPSHLMGQWPQEIQKFVGSTKKVIVLNNIGSFNKLTIRDVLDADIIVVNFTVLCNEIYFVRLLRFGGVDPESLPSGVKGGRHFDAVYDDCLKNVQTRAPQLLAECNEVFRSIEIAADDNDRRKQNAHETIRLDGKKSLYKKESKPTTTSVPKVGKANSSRAIDKDPWGLSTMSVQKNYEKMKCPPLELFYWNRVIVDEFTYLSKQDRSRALSLVLRLRSSFRWCLSGTPPHANFDDIQSLAALLQIHLGVDDVLPGTKLGDRLRRADAERTGLENLSLFLEVHSMQWHERRHAMAQKFLDRFVRQNIAEIDEIPYEEHIVEIDLNSAERAVYTELDTHLKSLDMNNKKALRSKIGTRGDREYRMHQALEGASCAEEALLKRCSHFDSSSLDDVCRKRESDKRNCEEELVKSIAAALRQRHRILEHQPNWAGTKVAEKGEVQDQLELYIIAVNKKESVSGGADDEVHESIKKLVERALEEVRLNGTFVDPEFAEVNGDLFIESDCSDNVKGNDETKGERKSAKRKRKAENEIKTSSADALTAQERLYDMKFALRNHMHKVRHLGKELCARIRSFRFLKSLMSFQGKKCTNIRCNGGPSGYCPYTKGGLNLAITGAFTLCGHVGCLQCLQKHAESNECVDPHCKAQVKLVHMVVAKDFVDDEVHIPVSRFGSKMTAIVDKVESIVSEGDRVIVFVQFDDLKQKVADALLERGVSSLQVKGSVQQQVRALSVLQKEKPDKKDPKVILLKMDDETSAGVNLTTCNHAVFVHPLLAATRQEYIAYETQAIGRIRRYGQTKKVHVWRFLARNTIDTEIFGDRSS